ncbi:P-loop containing nucleoside triphosphate hydrolase protein [Crucibulum laeve]|uniref:RNA helicase n=1 Tax=Crucibulum laeve TaxID=68775 RepID=A0A5C3M9E4_9AGAR|nr:P-loop containing nucleoside triphosphate hydrolase protein [Crucibulum laeve]
MPPRKGIVKTGNAGNSSKPTKVPEAPAPGPDVEKPLFPPGSKYPLSLLHERCQKLGWEKPIVDARQRGKDGWSFVITLSKMNKKTSQKETVRMEPHPPYCRPTPVEARHWGATYALYRFCNGIQLNRVLPAGPRDYWNELAIQHKTVPEHQKWMYSADPFAAQQEVRERQDKAEKKREEAVAPSSSSNTRTSNVSNEFSSAPEVRMASGLRELVEDAIKKGIALYPEAGDTTSLALSESAAPVIATQLTHLGFTQAQIKSVVKFLSQPSPLAANLLGSLSPLEASIEYLVLHVPECDLPARFLPSSNSSNPFITSAHSGTTNLKKRWVEDKAVKEAGWPAHVVKEYVSDTKLLESWDLLIVTLGRKLIGSEKTVETDVTSDPYEVNIEEFEALGATIEEDGHLVMPLFSAPIFLHILLSIDTQFPRPGYVPVYITSDSVPAYVRLHLLSRLLTAMQSGKFIESGEGFCMAIMRVVEGEWALIEDNGPPDISAVLEHIMPRKQTSIVDDMDQPEVSSAANSQRRGPYRRDNRTGAQIKEDLEKVRQKETFASLLASRQKLPAFTAKDEFLKKLSTNRVVIVVGETGCGKTTQLPQFILDSLIESNKGSEASIIVTQPRRISAISVAARVSYERLEDGSVGYAIRGESKQDARTKLLFCTTGVVLRRLGAGDSLKNVSHIVVDEVHERSVDGDFLLLELKGLLQRHPKLKVVLMSATINHETFVRYFDDAPLLTIPGFTHPVTDKYLEDVVPHINYRPPHVRPSKKVEDAQKTMRDEFKAQGLDDTSIVAIQNIIRSDRLDYQLIGSIVDHIINSAEKCGGILIFLPGVNEIRQTINAINDTVGTKNVDILPLHANLSNDEQRRVFQKTSKWKVVAATNVAETSITIDDIIYVIDAGKVKETQYDPETGLSRLVETWVTQAAARQRRGRAGRTQPGVCYKLYTRKQAADMKKFPIPEILRIPLESISLTVKAMREDEDVRLYLSQAIDPPKVAAMEKAWSVLQEIGAIDEAGKLTPLGKHISTLPVDIRLAKMLILGCIFQCLGPILTVAASLSSKPLFLSPIDKRDEANQARARFSTGGSDLLTDMKAYDEYLKMHAEGKSHGALRSFCEENFISPSTVRDIATLRQEFIGSLAEMAFIPFQSTPTTPALNRNSDNTNLVKAIILGGLWPHVARVHLPKSAIKFDKVQAGTVQRENTAREFKIFDLREGRVFLHPASVLFGTAAWKSPFLVYFHKHMTTKVFLRDATEVPLYALLLFGGAVSVNHVAGGVTIGTKDSFIKLKAWPRIGILVNQLRQLLNAQLESCVEDGTTLSATQGNPVVMAMLALLEHDGLSE